MSDLHRELVRAGLFRSFQKNEPREPLFLAPLFLPGGSVDLPLSLSNRFRRNKISLLGEVQVYLREVSQDLSSGNKFSSATISSICRLAEDLKQEVPPSRRNVFSVQVIPKLFELNQHCGKYPNLSGAELAKKLLKKF